jgi:uncharacterized protein
MHLSRYLRVFPDPAEPGRLILFSTRRCSVLSVTEDTLKRIDDGTLPETDRETLLRCGILFPDPLREREEMLSRFDDANRRSRRFNAMAVLNLDCNLACGYCFEEGVRGKREMSPEIADLLVALAEREHLAKGRKVSIDFYGGEPLLSLDLIRSIASRLKASSELYGLPFEFYLVTNGALFTRPVARELKELGMRAAKVTLDGPREVHDRSRPFVSGKGSFDIIMGNILNCLDIVDIQIGGNFTQESYREFPRLLDHFLNLGIAPEKLDTVQFSPVTGRVARGSVPDYPSACSCTDEVWLAEAAVYLREEILKRGFPTPKPGPAGCMVELENDIVVNVDGAVYRCPAFIGRDGFAVGSLQNGIGDCPVYGPDIWKNKECLDCPWLPQCFGGCRFLRFLREGNMNGVDCWKGFLDATVEKCILQDLKYRPQKRRPSNAETPV